MAKSVVAANASAAIGPYSLGVWAGDLLFVSGQTPIDPATGTVVPVKRLFWLSGHPSATCQPPPEHLETILPSRGSGGTIPPAAGDLFSRLFFLFPPSSVVATPSPLTPCLPGGIP